MLAAQARIQAEQFAGRLDLRLLHMQRANAVPLGSPGHEELLRLLLPLPLERIGPDRVAPRQRDDIDAALR